MRLPTLIGSTAATLMLIGAALADENPARSPDAGGGSAAAPQTATAFHAATAVVQLADATRVLAQIASNALVAPPAAEPVVAAETASPAPAAVLEAVAEPSPPPTPVMAETVAEPDATAKVTKSASSKHAKDKVADKAEKHTRRERLAAAEAKPVAVRSIGKAETGKAAWYGGRYLGRRTTSGARLDTTHATCAHRTLPLNSLARVTNLRNGRSVIVKVTDRGPVAESLLIDMSPRAAEELRMKQAGLVEVTVEQVVELWSDDK